MTRNAPSDNDARQLRSEERYQLLVESVRDYAIFMLDPAGHVLTWNAGAQLFTGYSEQEILGKHFSCFYPPEEQAGGVAERGLQASASTGSYEDEGWRVRKDASLYWGNVVVTAMRDQEQTLVGYATVIRDLSARRAHEEELRRSEERFRLLVEGVADYAIFMLDVNGLVATWNVGAERIKGYTAAEIVGQHFSNFYPADTRATGWPEYELQMAAEKGSFIDEGWRVRKDGTTFWASVTITALRDSGGRLIGFAKLTRDLTERKRAEAAEAASKQRDDILNAERNARMEAQLAARAKDEFLTTLSHELRTPLSAIMGWTQILLRQEMAMSVEHRHAVHVIDRNARAQVQLINDLLDLSRILSGKLRLDIRQISFSDVVTAAVESAKPAADAKDIRLKVMLDPIQTVVSGDSDRLQQVVWNLLSNAIKFTPKEGQVQVLLQRVNSNLELSVSDSGIGIAEDFLPYVFDRFSQRDGSAARSRGGLGLGLAITKQLTELHGGSVVATSDGEGKGSTFFVRLPISIVQLEEEREVRLHPTADGDRREHSDLPDLGDVHLFVVDDEPDARDVLRRVLQGAGAQVTAFSSAGEAMEALRHSRPRAIISDIGMPDMDGYQFMRFLRSREAKEDRIPALALTAFARPEDRKKALLAGYQAHLAKPFDIAELVLLIADLVKR